MEIWNQVFGIWVVCLMMCNCGWNVKVMASHLRYHDHHQFMPPSIVTNGQTRTGYHFQPHKHWINDPNGPMYYKGIYHLFYQYNPNGATWQKGIVWGHSISADLINWKFLNPAIYPSKPFDVNGCWSGSATILPGNKPVILYTGIDVQNRQVQNIAVPKNLSDPCLQEWVKMDRNPLIVPIGWINSSEFRDPTTAWFGPDGYWRVAVGSKHGQRGVAIVYRSKDFVHWIKAKHPLHSAKSTGMWECPDFFPVSLEGKLGLDTSEYGEGLKHVFKVSLDSSRYDYYTVGKYFYETDRYVPDNTSADDRTGLRYDYGNFYASKTFYDTAKNRRILWGWSNESDAVSDDKAKGWAGILTIPRKIWLDSNGRQLVQWPVDELETLRGKRVHLHDKILRPGDLMEVKGIESAQADVEVTFELPSLEKAELFHPSWTDAQELCALKSAEVKGTGIGPFGLMVLASTNLEEQTAVFFRVFRAESNKHVVLMCHDLTKSSLRPETYKPVHGAIVDIDIEKNGKISLRSLIDHSVVESFGGGGQTCITSRVYPRLAVGHDAHLYAFNNGLDTVRISQMKAWKMRKPRMM